jgi:hypothetical protein
LTDPLQILRHLHPVMEVLEVLEDFLPAGSSVPME